MVELVTPWSVAPVACPFPHGDGNVPNIAVDDDAAPLVAGASRMPAVVSEKSIRAAPAALVPVILVMAEPPSAQRGFCACFPPEPRTGPCVPRHHTNPTSRNLDATNTAVTRVEIEAGGEEVRSHHPADAAVC